MSVQLADLRRSEWERKGCADSSHSLGPRQTAQLDPNITPEPGCALRAEGGRAIQVCAIDVCRSIPKNVMLVPKLSPEGECLYENIVR